MSTARFKVHFAGPLVTFQDAGRIGHLRFGVPASGPMDRFSFAAAHAALAQSQTGTAIEVSDPRRGLGQLGLPCLCGSRRGGPMAWGFGDPCAVRLWRRRTIGW